MPAALCLVLAGFALVLIRPEWTSVATLVVLAVLAMLVAAREHVGTGAGEAMRLISDLRTRDDERAAALGRVSAAQDKQAADLKQMEERLSRLGAPAQKPRL